MQTSSDILNAFKQLPVLEQVALAKTINNFIMEYIFALAELQKHENLAQAKKETKAMWLSQIKTVEMNPMPDTTFDREYIYNDIPVIQ